MKKISRRSPRVYDKLHSYSKQPGFKYVLAPEEPNIGGRYCPNRKGRHIVVRYIFSLIIKHSPKGTGCTSGAVMPDCLGYLPTFGPAGAGQLALIYYELNCRVLSTIDPRRNLTARFVVHPNSLLLLFLQKKLL